MAKRCVVSVAGATILAMSAMSSADTGWFDEPAAPGPFAQREAVDLQAVQSLAGGKPVVGTYLFYWYDINSGAHVTYGDGGDACQDHPPTWEDYSYLSARWWRQELTDIAAAGIDFAAPVYWGHPGAYDAWSCKGLPHLVRAYDDMARAGESVPEIAMFYDTSTLQHNTVRRRIDLSTDDGKAWFYCSIRDFWSFVPPRAWAAIDGRPVILLYSPGFAAAQDPALFPYVRERFQADFGVNPYLIKQNAWQGEADNTCEWGGALGLQMAGCAALGPGYDHTAVRGRTPLIRSREDGAFYARSWETLLRFNPQRRPSITMVETWNEFHEGTDVANSREYGRLYIELTRKYTDTFHAGARLKGIAGPYSEAQSLSATFDGTREAGGMRVLSSGDGITELGEAGGRGCVHSAPSKWPARYVYFDVDESFAFDLEPHEVTIVVTYFDHGCDWLRLEYDSIDPDGSVRDGAFKTGGTVHLSGTKSWQTTTFSPADVRFANRSNKADFRLVVGGGGTLYIHRVEVSKRGNDE